MLNFLQTNSTALLSIFTALVTIASVLSNFTKTDSDNKIVAILSKLNDWMALNFNEPKKP